MDKILELNQILDEEIEFCEKFENLLLQKKDSLIHSKITQLREFDNQIYNAQQRLQEISDNKTAVFQKFGNGNLKLSDIIKHIDDTHIAKELETKRVKIQYFAQKITMVNKVVNSLIDHSLKMIDGSIDAIANAMAAAQTKGDYYNKNGLKENQELATLGAIVKEA